ncbi:deoxyguanosinetriphosphate triphosphohydrolase [Pyruvatibacter mobilis]|uniref:deoxyguanosinetriphosphate triphosphohydrolase n=1 Tax=Pyruvatibacter mobilis TaxID=1712261 RepID=UPI003D14AD44
MTSPLTETPSLIPSARGSRASYATEPGASRGRLVREDESRTRSPYQRDRDRIIHSGAFRRLKHKTQVFVYHEGDYYRTRLTHSLEVAQIARSLSRFLGLDEDIAEALALAHDLGHTPFGHAGEDALSECMEGYGGFDHNAQTLRIVTRLEQRYADFDGLNLTWETLEGVVKHNGPVLAKGESIDSLPRAFREYPGLEGLEIDTYAGLEAQLAALSDDIAYNNHDIDDGLRAGLFTVDDLMALPLVGDMFRSVFDAYLGLEPRRLRHEAIRRLISHMVEDVLAETSRRLAEVRPETADDVRRAGRTMASFSEEMQAHDRALKAFLFERMYRHFQVNRMMSKAKRVMRELFELFVSEPDLLPDEWQRQTDGPRSQRTAETVCDYVAGMTDRFAIEEHRRLFQTDPIFR